MLRQRVTPNTRKARTPGVADARTLRKPSHQEVSPLGRFTASSEGGLDTAGAAGSAERASIGGFPVMTRLRFGRRSMKAVTDEAVRRASEP